MKKIIAYIALTGRVSCLLALNAAEAEGKGSILRLTF
jgi:hypothetical protein